MRRLPRLRTPAASGFVPSQLSSGAFRAPAAAAAIAATSSTPSPSPRLNNGQTRRYLSTTPIRTSQTQPQTDLTAEQPEDLPDEYYQPGPAEIPTQLVYPRGITTAPPTAEVSDPSYKPAELAEGLEEVGGLAGWWDEPAHWGSSEGGAAQYVRSVASPFGPAEKVTDPAMLQVLAKRAIVEALVVARFAGAGKRKAVDRLFAHADGASRLGKIARVEVVAGEDGAATLKNVDYIRVWSVLKSRVVMGRSQKPAQEVEEVEGEKAAAEEVEAAAEPEVEATEAKAKKSAPAQQLTPQIAKSWIGTWSKEWKKAELRDPVVKFFAAKRIQQLTGHRIPDGKLLAAVSIDSLLQQLIEPPKPKKLAELIETKSMFKDLPNVRVFPRRVTPIDKEKMVGRWKIIVKELEKRELPVIGLSDHGKQVEKRWVHGDS